MSAATTPIVREPNRRSLANVLIYGSVIFLSAFLLFQVQPIITKQILPWFGGAAAVWSVCLLFFQAFLLFGYLYAHLLSTNFQPRAQAWIHGALLAGSLLALPITPRCSLQPTAAQDPTLRVLLVLAITVGLPYFLLSSTSPLLQAWLARSDSDSAPYRLYAISNAGSLLGLLSYPFAFEPWISSRHQAIGWSVAYAVVALLYAVLAWQNRYAERAVRQEQPDPAPAWRLKMVWIALPACASALLLSVTNHVSQNIAAIPLLWVIPLSLYLLTFIISFAGGSFYRRGFFLRLLVLALACVAFALAPGRGNLPPYVLIPLFCGCLFACCMVCHGELAALKPDSTHLTSFYLFASFGSALGASFVALLAPYVFSGYYELPIALGVCGALIHTVLSGDAGRSSHPFLSKRTFFFTGALVVAFCASLYLSARQENARARVVVRNFYGVLRVEDRVEPSVVLVQGDRPQPLDADPRYRDLINGTIEHGIQFLSDGRRRETTTYYGPNSGVGLALRVAGKSGSIRVGTIGLGAGTIAAYGRPGDQYTFYEINPLVVELANNEFSFLRQSEAQTKIILGDGRLSLTQQSPQQFDVLAVDAFSSDAIPVHLLTREAFVLYIRHTKPSGLIAVHISNKYLNLAPVVAAAADSLNRRALVIDSDADDAHAIYRATWVLVGSESSLLEQPEFRSTGWSVKSSIRDLWTDDYSSVLRAFR
jgi:MFS family permease